jgi:hypothetical protein
MVCYHSLQQRRFWTTSTWYKSVGTQKLKIVKVKDWKATPSTWEKAPTSPIMQIASILQQYASVVSFTQKGNCLVNYHIHIANNQWGRLVLKWDLRLSPYTQTHTHTNTTNSPIKVLEKCIAVHTHTHLTYWLKRHSPIMKSTLGCIAQMYGMIRAMRSIPLR